MVETDRVKYSPISSSYGTTSKIIFSESSSTAAGTSMDDIVGISFCEFISIDTVAILESSVPSFTVYVNSSLGFSLPLCSYINEPSEFKVNIPSVTSATSATERRSPSPSESFTKTPGKVSDIVPPSSTL